MEWKQVKPSERLLVTLITDGLAVIKQTLTKEEFEKIRDKSNVIGIYSYKFNQTFNLIDVSQEVDGWDFDETKEKMSEYQIETLRNLYEMTIESQRFLDNGVLNEEEVSEWIWESLPLLNGVVETLENFSGGEILP